MFRYLDKCCKMYKIHKGKTTSRTYVLFYITDERAPYYSKAPVMVVPSLSTLSSSTGSVSTWQYAYRWLQPQPGPVGLFVGCSFCPLKEALFKDTLPVIFPVVC